MENFVGIDLHKYVSQLAVLRESKSPSQLRFANDVVTVERVLKKLPEGSKIAVEAMGSWWWLVELAQKSGHEVFLSHPKQTKAIASARLKSDKVDALMLAKLLKADLLPTVWIPPATQRHIRELLSHRGRLVRQRTAVINELRAVYAKRNIDPEAKLQRARPIVSGAEDLSGYGPRIVEEDLKLLEFINRQIGGLDKEGNRMVRMLLIQAALVHTRRGKGPSRKHYLGVVKRRGKQIARVAVANKLIGAIFHMMKEGMDYSDSSGVAAHSEPVLFHGPKTVLLIGQLCLSRGRIAGFKIMRFEKARRDEWVATRYIDQAGERYRKRGILGVMSDRDRAL